MKKKILSMLLVIVLVLHALPMQALAANSSVPLTLVISSYGAPFIGNSGEHDNYNFEWLKYIERSAVGSDNAEGYAKAYFTGNNTTGWDLCLYLKIGNYEETLYEVYGKRITNKDMSNASGDITFGLSFNTSGGTRTYISITGGTNLAVNYTLNYDANGGTGAPAAQTGTSSSGSYMFTISQTVPTKDYSEFKGWALTSDAPEAAYQPGGSITVREADNPETLYAVWTHKHEDTNPEDGRCDDPVCNECLHEKDNDGFCTVPDCDHPHGDGDCCPLRPTDPVIEAPQAPGIDELNVIFNDSFVIVDCVNAEVQHADGRYGLIDGGYTVGTVSDAAPYTCTVTFIADAYVAKYAQDNGTAHTTEAGNASVILTWDEVARTWTKTTESVTFEAICENPEAHIIEAPEAPGIDELNVIFNDGFVIVDCVNAEVEHVDGRYGLIDGGYTVGTVSDTAPYTCTVTFIADAYVARYAQDNGTAHTTEAGNAAVVLTWDEVSKTWTKTTESVTFEAVCETPAAPVPEAPQAPGVDELNVIFNDGFVIVDCVNAEVEHADGRYGLIDGGYTVGTVSDTAPYTCTVTFIADAYVARYAQDNGTAHTTEAGNAAVILTWDEVSKTWTKTTESVTFEAVCENPEAHIIEAPEAPGIDELNVIFNDGFVIVDCVNAEVEHVDGRYGLIDGGYTVGTVSDAAPYTCTVTFIADAYVARYAQDNGTAHTTAAGNAAVVLTWDEVARIWTKTTESVTFEAICETPAAPLPEAPQAPGIDELNVIFNDGFVIVDCVNAEVQHVDGRYGLIDGGYTVGTVSDAAPYTCTVTFIADAYVAKYAQDNGTAHTTEAGNASVILTWDEVARTWTKTTESVTFEAICETPSAPLPEAPQAPGIDKPSIPQTGDNTNLWLWVALLFVSGGCLFATAIYRKKQEAE